MIKRIVRLTFKTNKESIFLNEILQKQKHYTRNFNGCSHLELWQDINNPNIIFSYSYWEDEIALNKYRNSEKFRLFWKETKQHFSEPAYAVSVQVIEQINK